jgi:hypothetical protein
VFFEKEHDQKMFGPLFSDSAYVSDAKTTFGMFGMICFAVDSQTHTLCMYMVNVYEYFKPFALNDPAAGQCIFSECFITIAVSS